MSNTLKQIGVEWLTFPKSRQDEAIHQQTILRLNSFIHFENEIFNWNNIIAKPELIEIKAKKPIQYLSPETIEDDLLQNDAQWPFAENSLFLFKSDNPFRMSLFKSFNEKLFIQVMRFITLLNIIAVCLYDYQSRINKQDENRNRISITMEIFCNIIFGLECFGSIIVKGFVLGRNAYLKSWWNVVNFLTFISTWSILGDINSENQLIHILRVIRLFRALRLIQDSKILKKQFDAFIGSFQRLGPILILQIIYIISINLFYLFIHYFIEFKKLFVFLQKIK